MGCDQEEHDWTDFLQSECFKNIELIKWLPHDVFASRAISRKRTKQKEHWWNKVKGFFVYYIPGWPTVSAGRSCGTPCDGGGHHKTHGQAQEDCHLCDTSRAVSAACQSGIYWVATHDSNFLKIILLLLFFFFFFNLIHFLLAVLGRSVFPTFQF